MLRVPAAAQKKTLAEPALAASKRWCHCQCFGWRREELERLQVGNGNELESSTAPTRSVRRCSARQMMLVPERQVLGRYSWLVLPVVREVRILAQQDPHHSLQQAGSPSQETSPNAHSPPSKSGSE